MAKTYDLNFRIKTDAKPTRRELEMTAGEFRDFNRTVKSAQTPLDRFEKDLSDLNKAFQTGKIRSDQYQHALKRIESQYEKTSKKQRKMFSGMKDGFKSGLAGMAAGFVGFHTVQKGLETVREQMEAIDKVAKTARGVGASTEFLTGLEFAAQRTSGLAAGAATKGIEKMTRRIEEAALGTGEAIKALEMLGLEAEALAALSPEEQFKVLSRAMDGVTDAGQRTLIATKLFDDEQSKLHTTMALTNSEMKSQIELAKRLGKVVTEEEARKAEAYADQMQELDAMQAKYEKAMAMNAMGGANIFAAESQIARGRFATAFLEGDLETKAELGLGFLGGGLFGMSDKTSLALTGGGNRAKTQKEIDEQRNQYRKEEAEQFDKETARLMAEKEKGQAAQRIGAITNIFDRQLDKAKETASAISGGFQHFGLSVAGQFDRAMNVRREKEETEFDITRTTADPAESIGAGSSEAFKIFNQQTSLQKVEKDTAKQTEKNTKATSDTLGAMLDFMQSAPSLGL
jgi:hypothetical protein